MSAILAGVGSEASALPKERISELLGRMSYRGSMRSVSCGHDLGFLAAARDDWELSYQFAGPVLIAERENCRVICDATLYYVEDLKATLHRAGVKEESDSAADLIAAAYEAFGQRCVDVLEGDFAICVWDTRSRQLFCARDPFGCRSLFYTEIGGGFVFASTPHPLVALRGDSAGFSAEGVLRSVLMRYGDGTTTAWDGVSELPAAHFMIATPGQVRVERYWAAKSNPQWVALDADEAVEALKGLLTAAAMERHEASITALAMSGGYDSTALLASIGSGSTTDLNGAVDILSFRYPEDDPNHEHAYVELTAELFGLPIKWLPVSTGFFANVEHRARIRSHCHGQSFEGLNRSVARRALELGDRVVLNGHGGDSVFGLPNWHMADLLRRGRWLQLRKYMVDRGYRARQVFVPYVLRPAVPTGVYDALEHVLGRSICTRPYERPVPSWISADAALLASLTTADRRHHSESVDRRYKSIVSRFRAWGLMDASFTRACAALYDMARDEGTELRMPFYDRRLIEFAMSRPPEDLNEPGQQKAILAKAIEDRLPKRESRLLRGGIKPGSAAGLVASHWSRETNEIIEQLGSRSWIAEDLGVVDPNRFIADVDPDSGFYRFSNSDVSLTLYAELWLRSNSPW